MVALITPDDDGPVEKRKTVPPITNELGRTGLKHFSGTVYEEFLPQLQGERGVRVYREMRDNNSTIGSMLFAVEHLLRSVDWAVEPASESPEDLDAAQFLEECMFDMSVTWEDFISEVLSMLPYGWSYFEVVYKPRKGKTKAPTRFPSVEMMRDGELPTTDNPSSSKYDDGLIGWRKFAIRSQETLDRWQMDDNGGIQGMWQYPTPGTPFGTRNQDSIIFLPIEKCLLFRTTSHKNNPEGRSILRNAYRSWYICQRIEEIEAIGAERDLAGMPIARVPIELLATNRSDEQTAMYNLIKDIVTRVKQDQQMGIIWPNVYDDQGNRLYEFELINAQGKRAFDTGSIIQRYQQQMAMTILADFILLGHESVGSFALSSDKTELFAVAMGSWLDSIAEVLNRYAVARLFELNSAHFGDLEELPRIVHGDIEDPDLTILGGFIQTLAGAGAPIFPDLVLENTLREMAGLPPADPEEREALMAQGGGMQMPGMPPSPGAESGGPGQPPESSDSGGGQRPPTVGPAADDDAPVAVGKAKIRPTRYDGTSWRPARSRRRFLRGKA